MDDNCWPLANEGARGVLFKVRLASYGYTVAAKGTVPVFLPELRHEFQVYQRLYPLQGSCVPVCLGQLDLEVPYSLPEGVRIVHMLLLSWAGKRLEDRDLAKPAERQHWANKVARAMEAIHRAGVLHNDFRTCHLLRCPQTGRAMIIDFERSTLRPLARTPLSPVKHNRRTKRPANHHHGDDKARPQHDDGSVEKDSSHYDSLARSELICAQQSVLAGA
jgi:hypothetical protein